jgi:hypothetical protein
MKNLEFEYRYRDCGNFKNRNSIVFGNKRNLSAEETNSRILQIVGNDQTFEASRLRVPEMFFKEFPYDPELDWPMHEYCGVSETDLPATDTENRDIGDLLALMEKEADSSKEEPNLDR